MAEGSAADPGGDSASITIHASAERCYDIVSDVTQMGRLSPECTGGSWLDGATGPAKGARFRGTNKRGIVRWITRNTVVAADPGKEFAFETADSGTRWSYEFTQDGKNTVVTQSRSAFKERPLVARLFSRFALGGIEEHDDEMRAGLTSTLERLKQVAEEP